MATGFGHLSRDELEELAADQALVIAQLTARLSKGGGDRLRKSSKNSHQPPSSDRKGTTKGARSSKEKKPRPSRPGVSRTLSASPDAVVTVVRAVRRTFRAHARRCAAAMTISIFRPSARW